MLKDLTLKFFSAFAKPAHVEIEQPSVLEEQYKAWKIVLSQRSLMEKVNEAKKVQPEVMQKSEEHLKKNSGLLDAFLSTPMIAWDPQWSTDKKWRVKE